ncbi:hypothetical protein FGADI_9206 [Fusarium gaditjirri]|uniref:Uncharacterized protein n=1 Tax=Fusarium gaditjirri TaxID=282569 RepID=A0A8H4T042_9HYPO|nr:hypothetical protein FGADI_9206 [Fusarium gaditjirri]
MCSFLVREKNIEIRDQNEYKYRHINAVLNPPAGKYIIRSDPEECLIAGQRSFWVGGPHAITPKKRPIKDHTPAPTFKSINWAGTAGAGARQLRKKSPLGSVRNEYNSPKPVFKKVNWNGGGHPVRTVSPRGSTFGLVSDLAKTNKNFMLILEK